MTTVLALDAGQTGVRTQLLLDGTAGAVQEFDGVLTDRPVLPQLAEVVRRSLATTAATDVEVAIGSSGLTDDMTAEALLELLADGPVTAVHLAHDSTTSYLGALGDVPGVVVAAGTGVVTLAVGLERVARVDGWGFLIGDAGSGYWIGRAGLDAVMRAHDGRGPATSLTEPAVAEFGDLEGAYIELQADEHKVSRIAAWARRVNEHAEAGDAVCREVLHAAGRELAGSVLAGMRMVGLPADAPVATLGKVFGSEAVNASFQQELREQLGTPQVVAAHSSGLDGAALLPRVHPSSALAGRIRTARKA
ncbi:N-acetylglucosamine kinase [Luteococcus peritonei]|uniref:N-acetylglucosamine kinase n=1 Tax=Luteococcus peritonei TaxID=88874 RepID=A0ABW4RXF0_9ACTN